MLHVHSRISVRVRRALVAIVGGALLSVVAVVTPGASQEQFGDRRVYHVHRMQTVQLEDVDGHELILTEHHGYDVRLGNFTIAHAVSDVVNGNGRVSGYATTTDPDGDRAYYTFQGDMTRRPGGAGTPMTTTKGTWVLTGGTGKWVNRTGRGTFTDTGVSPTSTVAEWAGTWEEKRR